MARDREVMIPAPWNPFKVVFVVAAIVCLAAAALMVVRAIKPARSERIEVQGAPDVVLAMRDLSKLETESYHLEKVVQISDKQEAAFGLLEAEDALLLVAVGDVVAGIDFGKLDSKGIQTDWAKRSVKLVLPAPEVFSSKLDSAQTKVFSRKTDALAKRDETLESKARLYAEQSMQKAAVDAGVLDRARIHAEKTVRATLGALGFQQIDITFAPSAK
ncbi:MAG: DUF4230 domain-containing protein [Polyangiales bacterium]